MSSTPPSADIDSEREVDLSGWGSALARRWWIVALGVVAGAAVGAIFSLSGGSVWQASVLLSPGQAFSPNGSPVLVYQSSPRSINDIATQETSLVRAAAVAHMPVSALRNHVSTQSVSTGLGSTAARGSVLIRITVQASKPKRAAAAANVLGDVVIADTTSPYVQKSIASLQRKLASYQKQLVSVGRLVDQYNATLKASNLAPFDKLILVNQVDNALLRQGNLNDKIAATDAQLTLAQNIEIAQIVSKASAVKTTARSRRNSILVGALIGLILGAIVAIATDSRLRRAQSV
jgi:capsular polysaccharide biosynthesis protein